MAKKVSFDYTTSKIDPSLNEIEIDGKRLPKPDAIWISSVEDYVDEDYEFAEKSLHEDINYSLKKPFDYDEFNTNYGTSTYKKCSLIYQGTKLVTPKLGAKNLNKEEKNDEIKRFVITCHYVVKKSQLGDFTIKPQAASITKDTDLSDRFGSLEVDAQIKPAEESTPALQLLEIPNPLKVYKKKKKAKKKKTSKKKRA